MFASYLQGTFSLVIEAWNNASYQASTINCEYTLLISHKALVSHGQLLGAVCSLSL